MRKRILAMLLCLCMVLCMIPLTASAEETTTPKTYVALGDSIPSGYGVEEGQAFPELLADTCGYTLVNLAEDGATVGSLGETIKGNLTDIASADIITITVGGNDLMNALYSYAAKKYNEGKEPDAQLTAEQIQQKLAAGDITLLGNILVYLGGFADSAEAEAALKTFSNTMIETIVSIKAVNSTASIILTTQYNPYAFLAKELEGTEFGAYAIALNNGFNSGVAALNTVINSMPDLTKACTVVDVYSAFQAAEKNPCNAYFTSVESYTLDYHPNAYGHSLIAQVLDETINPLPFDDVAKDQWYYAAVRYAYFNNLMAGTGENKFEPGAVLDRATVVQILYNLEGQPEVEKLTDKFTDVTNEWYAKAITWAVENGVVAGYEDETFRPTIAIDRETFAQMMYNYAKYKKYDLTVDTDLSEFTDAGKVSDWAETALTWANGKGLINGNGDGTINPTGGAQRSHAASILRSFCENVVVEVTE